MPELQEKGIDSYRRFVAEDGEGVAISSIGDMSTSLPYRATVCVGDEFATFAFPSKHYMYGLSDAFAMSTGFSVEGDREAWLNEHGKLVQTAPNKRDDPAND